MEESGCGPISVGARIRAWVARSALLHQRSGLVVWMQGYYSLETENKTSRFWADILARKMEEIMVAHGCTADMMTTWDPKKQTVHDHLRADSHYAHLFKVPSKEGD